MYPEQLSITARESHRADEHVDGSEGVLRVGIPLSYCLGVGLLVECLIGVGVESDDDFRSEDDVVGPVAEGSAVILKLGVGCQGDGLDVAGAARGPVDLVGVELGGCALDYVFLVGACESESSNRLGAPWTDREPVGKADYLTC